MSTSIPVEISLGSGIYTIPDASLILRLPLTKLRRWVVGTPDQETKIIDSWGEGKERAFDFNELIEAYSIYSLRSLGISLQKIKSAHRALSKIFDCRYPFAKRGILTDGSHILFDESELGKSSLVNLTDRLQYEFRGLVLGFCDKVDFSEATDLASAFWPMGKDRSIVVDPKRAFGRPVMTGTNTTTEAVYALFRGGEAVEDLSDQYDQDPSVIKDAIDFHKLVA
ncbi:MAG: DUF433 domain-containing protein [Verrucomicrobiota bacterium]